MADPTPRLAPALRSLLEAARQEADPELLRRFVGTRDEGAFGELMSRHGPMVFGVSRRVTGDVHVAEDVFQATFLTLARKAGSIRRPDALGAWLHQTAFRLALRSRKARALKVAPPPRQCGPSPLDALTARELLAVLDDELARLPEGPRVAVLLCGLEGLSLEEAARRLGWTTGSVKGRLERGRERLRQRLERRGLSLGGVMAAPLFDAGPRAGLLEATGAVVFGGKASASVLALAGGGVPVTRLALAGAVLVLTGVLGAGAALQVAPPTDKPAPPPAASLSEPLPARARLRLGDLERRAVGARVAVTADGKSIVAVSQNTRQISEWDFRTGKLLGRRPLPVREVGEVRELSPDGRWLVTNETGDAPGEQRAVVWDVRASKPVRKLPFKGLHVLDQPAAFSADGRRLALPVLFEDGGKRKNQIRVWDWQRGAELLVGEVEGNDSIGQVAFSADGNQVLMTLHADNSGIHCWDVATRKKLWSNTPARPKQMVVLPQGKVLSLELRRVVEHDLRTGAVTTTLRLPSLHFDDPVRVTPKGDKLLVSGREGVAVIDIERGRRLLFVPSPWASVTVAPDGASVVTNTGSLQRWDLATGKPAYPDEGRKGHAGEVRTLVFTAGGTRLVSGSADGSIGVWDATTGQPLHLWRHHAPRRRTFWRAHPHGGVKTLDVTPDGRHVFSAGEADGFHLWDVASGEDVGWYQRPEPLNEGYSETTHSLRLARDGRSALALLCPGSGGFGKEVTGRLLRWDFDSGKVTTVCQVDRLVYWTSDVDPEGRWFANRGRVFDARTGRAFATLDEYGAKAPVDAAFAPDGLLVAGGAPARSDNNSLTREGPAIHVWEAVTGKVVARLPGPGLTGEKVFHPAGRYLAYNQGSRIHLLDLHSEKEVKTWEMPAEMCLDGFGHARVSSFAFSPDGKTLATGHPDGTILLWDAGLPAENPAPVRPGELESLWKQLGDDDAKQAYHAAWRLTEIPAEAVPLLRGKLKPARVASDKVTGPLIADLDGDTLAKRDAATRRLRELGHAALPAVAEALKAPASAEQKRRLAQLLAELERPGGLGGDRLRYQRAAGVLGWVNTPEARKALDALAEGNAFAPLTQQAKASLARR